MRNAQQRARKAVAKKHYKVDWLADVKERSTLIGYNQKV
jgi:hypothetical protein